VRETAPAWRGDWQERVRERIRQRGSESLQAYLKGNAGVPYSDLARDLAVGDDIAPVQLERLHAQETVPEQRQGAVFDSLTRFLRGSLKKGWGVGRYWESDVIGTLVSWSVTWGRSKDLDQVERALFSIPPPTGWKPEPQGDPILNRAFEQAPQQQD
jgi:hypothetical protein